MQELKVINSFKEDYEKFSNFCPVLVYYRSLSFPSVEHAYVAGKSLDPMFWRKIAEIPEDKSGKAKRLGRKVKLRENWDVVKLSHMRDLLLQKFQYPSFKNLLFSTGDIELVEGNYWHDNYWGDCYCPKCTDIVGQNQLGKMLMKVREKIK